MVQSECTMVKHGQSEVTYFGTRDNDYVCRSCQESLIIAAWQHYNYDRRTENFERGDGQFSDI